MKKISLIITLAGLLLATACQKEKPQPLEANFECDIVSALVGDEITFNDTSLGSASRWNWTFEGGEPATSELSQPVVRWMHPGTYSVTLTVSNKDSKSEITKEGLVTINYHSTVKADFTIDKTQLFDDEEISITNTSTGFPETVKWTLTPKEGTPIVLTDYNINRKIPVGEYAIKLEVSNPLASDTKELADAFKVLDRYAVIAAVGAENATTYEGGKVYFKDASQGNAQYWEWTFEGGNPATSTEQNPVVTYSTTGSYKVKLRTYNDKYESIDEVADYVKVVPAADLVFMLPFDGSVKDYGPNGITPSYFSLGGYQVNFEEASRAGGKSIKFPGGAKGKSYCVLQMPDALANNFPNGSDFTMSVWTKLPGSITSNNAIFAQGNCPGTTPVNQIWSRFQSGGVIRCTAEATGLTGNTATSKSGAVAFDDGSWHHVCIVYAKDSNGKRDLAIYADGQKLVEANDKDEKETLSLPYFIGCNLRLTSGAWAPENMFTGWMDDYILYKKGFTASEVEALYNLYK